MHKHPGPAQSSPHGQPKGGRAGLALAEGRAQAGRHQVQRRTGPRRSDEKETARKKNCDIVRKEKRVVVRRNKAWGAGVPAGTGARSSSRAPGPNPRPD